MHSDFWWKEKVLPLWQITFDLLKLGSKVIYQRGKTLFFIINLRAFCIYFLQVLKIRIWGHLLFAGIACKIYLLMPSNFDEKMPFDYDWFYPLKMIAFMIIKGTIICWYFLKALPSADNFHCILREITVYFSDEVFSLKIWGHFIQHCIILSKFGELIWTALQNETWCRLQQIA